MNHLLLAPLLLPLLAGMVNLLLARGSLERQRLVSLLALILTIAASLILAGQADNGTIQVYPLGNWPAPFGIVLVLDRLSALMLSVTAVLFLPVLGHAMQADDRRGGDFHVFFPLQLLGINGAFLTGDLFNLFVFFEILLIASYCLSMHGAGPRRTASSLRYVVLNLVGSSLFLIALGTLYGTCGTLNMADLARVAPLIPADQSWMLSCSALLLLVVFGLKGAILPLFLWLPPLYSSVLPAVAAMFAIMTKVGIYAIVRTAALIFPLHGPAPMYSTLLLPLALLTLAAGVLGVLGSQRLRGMIAYLVIVSAGTLLTGIGLWTTPALGAALYYLPHTTLTTAGFFLLTDHLARQRGLLADQLVPGPPLKQATCLGSLFFLGALAVAGLPPLSGFIGKVLLLQAAPPDLNPWIWFFILGGGLLILAALARAGSQLFWKTSGAPLDQPAISWLQLMPASALILTSMALSILATPLSEYTAAAAAQILDPPAYINAVLTETMP